MADVFVSYARSTEACARALADIIEGDGYSVWYDARLPAHRPYADVIQEQLDAAKAVLIIWSKEAVGSHWVRSEADRGRMNGTLVQLRIEDCALPMPFDQIQCPLVRDWEGSASAAQLAPILQSLSALLDGSGAARPFSSAPAFSRPEEAQLLFEGASKALQSGDPAEHAQAIPLLIEATSVAPDDAQAWGLLAVLYAARRLEVAPSDRPAMVARARSAITSALTLDPADARARCAELILVTAYRNWKRKEEGAREILRHAPDQPLALFSLATMLGHVGRWREAAEAATRISRTRFLLPMVEQFTVYALWSAGNVIQAEIAGERAARRFPAHAGLWEARVALQMHSGRAGDALSFLESNAVRPPDYPRVKLEALRLTARALLGSIEPTSAVRKNLEAASLGSIESFAAAIEPLMAAQRCAALGGLDECFSFLDGYYFGKGPWASIAPAAGDEDRLTWPLFTPPMRMAWADERFNALMAAIGLKRYWDETGLLPDYQRG